MLMLIQPVEIHCVVDYSSVPNGELRDVRVVSGDWESELALPAGFINFIFFKSFTLNVLEDDRRGAIRTIKYTPRDRGCFTTDLIYRMNWLPWLDRDRATYFAAQQLRRSNHDDLIDIMGLWSIADPFIDAGLMVVLGTPVDAELGLTA